MLKFLPQENGSMLERSCLGNCHLKKSQSNRCEVHKHQTKVIEPFFFSKSLGPKSNKISYADGVSQSITPPFYDQIFGHSRLMLYKNRLHEVGFSRASSHLDREHQVNALTEILNINQAINIRPKLIEQTLERLYTLLQTGLISSVSIPSKVKLYRAMLSTLALRKNDSHFVTTVKRNTHLILGQELSAADKSYLLSGLVFYSCLKGEHSEIEEILNHHQHHLKKTNVETPKNTEMAIIRDFYKLFSGDGDNINGNLPIPSDFTSTLFLSVFLLAKGGLTKNKHQDALRGLMYLKRHSYIEKHWISGFCHILKGWAYLENDKPDSTICHLANAKHIIKKNNTSYFITLSHILRTIAYIEKDLNKQANHALQKSLSLAKKYEFKQLQYNCLLIKAELSLKSSNDVKIRSSIKQAFSFGRKHGLFHTWFSRPYAMSTLCIKALDANLETKYASKLTQKHDLTPSSDFSIIEMGRRPVKIGTFDKFSMIVHGKSINFNKRMRKTPFTMLKILIAMGGRGVPASLINDMLWPEAVGDEAFNRHKITLHRLKKILEHGEAIVATQGQLSLNPKVCWVDLWEIEKLFQKITHYFCRPTQSQDTLQKGMQTGTELISKINGKFLPQNNELWAIKYREIIKQKYIYCLYKLASTYEKTSNIQAAIKLYKKGLSIYPEVEYLYQRLIHCYKFDGRHSEAAATYKACEKILSMQYALTPSIKTSQIFANTG